MIIAIRKSAWTNASVRNRTIFRYAAQRLALGTPATYETAGGQEWYLFADSRFSFKDLARLGTLVAGIATNTTYVLPETDGELDVKQLRSDMVAWVQSRIVWPVDVDGEDPYTAVLDAQGAPAVLRAAGGIPSGLTPVGD